MLKEEEEADLFFNLMTGRFRYEIRELERAYEQAQGGNPEEIRSINQEKHSDFLFVSKYQIFVGFYNHIESKVFGLPTYDKQRTFLVHSIIRSIVQNSKIDMREFDSKPESDREKKYKEYTRRNAQTLLRNYEGIFFPSLEKSKKGPRDDRVHPYSTVYSSDQIPDSPHHDQAIISLMAKEFQLGSNEQWSKLESLPKMLNSVNPIYLKSVLNFKSIIDHCLNEIDTDDPNENDRIIILKRWFSKFNPILTSLYWDCSTWVALGWWRKKSKQPQKTLIQRGFPFNIDDDMVNDSIILLRKVGLDHQTLLNAMNTASVGFTCIKKYEYSQIILEAMYKLPENSDTNRGIILESQGEVSKLSNNPKKAVSYIKRSIDHYQKAGDVLRVALGYVYLGTTRLNNNNTEGKKDFEKAVEIANKLHGDEKFDALYCMADLAKTFKNKNLERHFLRCCRSLHDEISDDRMYAMGVVCDRLLRFI